MVRIKHILPYYTQIKEEILMEIEKSEQKLINNDIIGTTKPKIAFKKINEISNF